MERTLINIEDLRVDCKIGVWTHERQTTQQLRVDMTVEFDGEAAAQTDDLVHTLNYADLAREVTFILEEGHFLLLEAAARMICRWTLLPPAPEHARPAIQNVELKLTKFGALPGSTLASVQTRMTASEVDYQDQGESWGQVEHIGTAGKLSLSRVTLSPDAEQPAFESGTPRGAILVLSEGLFNDAGLALPLGRRSAWNDDALQGHVNQGSTPASFLLFIESSDDAVR
jgi:7,8-dihydroneopterin aldolase/epimerase/oxygenase